ncbi:MAG: methyltransferase [bacterium]|nr:methyltransferase [bacterium]
MNSRERILGAIEHRAPDRVPLDLGSTSVSGIHVSCVAALREYYGIANGPVKVHEPYQMLGWIDEDLREILGVDAQAMFPHKTMFGHSTLNGWKEWRMPDGLEVLVPADFNVTIGEDGVIYMHPQGDLNAPPSARMPNDGYFFDAIIRQPPLDEANLKVEDNLEEYGPIADETVAYIASASAQARASGRAVVASLGGTALGDIAHVPAVQLKYPKGIRDVAEWYMSIASRPELIRELFERQTQIALANLARIAAAAKNSIDVVFVCGTDFGAQTGTFCSRKTFQSLWTPFYTTINEWIHANTPWKTFKHSCGSVRKFIPDFIECGFDILNPVQCSAANMEAGELKNEFGERITFWGGGIDTQKTLPFGSPGDVREETLRRCEIFSCGGGFVFNTIHNIQARTPVENIATMIDAVHEFNGTK